MPSIKDVHDFIVGVSSNIGYAILVYYCLRLRNWWGRVVTEARAINRAQVRDDDMPNIKSIWDVD